MSRLNFLFFAILSFQLQDTNNFDVLFFFHVFFDSLNCTLKNEPHLPTVRTKIVAINHFLTFFIVETLTSKERNDFRMYIFHEETSEDESKQLCNG